jgi:hypothetical protein
VERNKEGDGFGRFRWGETKEQDAVGGARLTIETGADFPIGPRSEETDSDSSVLAARCAMTVWLVHSPTPKESQPI